MPYGVGVGGQGRLTSVNDGSGVPNNVDSQCFVVHLVPEISDGFLLKVNLSLLQYSDGRLRQGLLMVPLLQGGRACHTPGFVYFQYGNALSIVFIF